MAIDKNIKKKIDSMIMDSVESPGSTAIVPEQITSPAEIATTDPDVFTGESEQVAGVLTDSIKAGISAAKRQKEFVKAQGQVPINRPVVPQGQQDPLGAQIIKEQEMKAAKEQAATGEVIDQTKNSATADAPLGTDAKATVAPMTQQQRAEYERSIQAPLEEGVDARPSVVGGGRLSADFVTNEEDFARHMAAIRDAVRKDVDKISYEKVFEEALQKGWTQKDIDKLIDPNSRMSVDVNEAATNILIRLRAAENSNKARDKFLDAYQNDTLTPKIQMEYQNAMDYEAAVTEALTSNKTELARTFGIHNFKIDDLVNSSDEHLMKVLSQRGGSDRLLTMALISKHSKKGNSPKQREWTSRMLAGGAKTRDILYYTYYSNILSSPDTFQRIIGGTGIFAAYKAIHKIGDVVVGNVRYGVQRAAGVEDATLPISMRELMLDALILPKALGDGIRAAGRGFKTNMQHYGNGRIDFVPAEKNPFYMAKKENETIAGKATRLFWNGLGMVTSVPHRGLIAMDDFFKAAAMRMELSSLAARRAEEIRVDAIKSGKTDVEAESMANEVFQSLVEYPSPEIWNQAVKLGEDITLTGRLTGALGKLEDLYNAIPGMRVVMSFFRSPMNGIKETTKIIPGLNLAPDLVKALREGGSGRDFDIAVSKLAIGSYAAASIADMSGFSEENEWGITGAMPYDQKSRKMMMDRGVQPFSYYRKRSMFTPEEIEQIKNDPNVTITDEFVFRSYIGYEPVGAMVGAIATITEYLQHEEFAQSNDPDYSDPEAVAFADSLITSSAIGMGSYLSEVPMLTSLSGFFDAVAFRPEDVTGTEAFLQEGSRVATNFAMLSNPFDPSTRWAGMQTYANKLFSPEIYQKTGGDLNSFGMEQDYNEADPMLRGVLDAIAQNKSNSAYHRFFYGDELLPKYNTLHGNQLEKEGSMVERGFATRNTLLDQSVERNLLTVSGVIYPNKAPHTYSKIRLKPNNKHDFEYALGNVPLMDEDGNPTHFGRTAKQELSILAADKDLMDSILNGTDEEKKDAIEEVSAVVAAAKKSALYYTMQQDPEFAIRVNEIEQKRFDATDVYQNKIEDLFGFPVEQAR